MSALSVNDIIKWLNDIKGTHLAEFRLNVPLKISFQLTEKQFKSIQDTIDMFGNTKVGRSKALRMISMEILWRRPIQKTNQISLNLHQIS